MGDRIVVNITDGTDFTPDFYGHWCGLRALKVLNDMVSAKISSNGIHSMFCNYLIYLMKAQPQPYSYYVYNHGDAKGIADWDNYEWTYHTDTDRWTTTNPQYADKRLTRSQVTKIVKRERPELYKRYDNE